MANWIVFFFLGVGHFFFENWKPNRHSTDQINDFVMIVDKSKTVNESFCLEMTVRRMIRARFSAGFNVTSIIKN